MSQEAKKDVETFNGLPATTAAISPDQFPETLGFVNNRWLTWALLMAFVVVGFGLRVNNLGSESFAEDEFNKLKTVEEYRLNGLTGTNGEHPFLMKGLQTVSLSSLDRIGTLAGIDISREFALRLPLTIFGTLTVIMLFLFLSQLFGKSIGLVAAALWAIEPTAVGFDRIAKEDSLVLFFFLLANYLWIRGQTAAETGDPKWPRFAWAAAAGFAALMASKYYPHLLGITAAYYIIFQRLPQTKWRMGKARWLKFMAIMGVVFLFLNLTILLPDTWHEMLTFSSERRIGHDGNEYWGVLYPNKMTAWLSGVPWTFYFVFIAIKISLATLVLFIIGLPLLFRRSMGDGRFFLLIWSGLWLLSYTFLGGKFTRYFTVAEPIILTIAAVGACTATSWIVDSLDLKKPASYALQIAMVLSILAFPLINSVESAPHFRMFTNSFGGAAAAGTFFPHDEFYDAATAETVRLIAQNADIDAVTACETPALHRYYAEKIGRGDLRFVSLSDAKSVAQLTIGDFIVDTSGRRYFSNSRYLDYLSQASTSSFVTKMNSTTAARIYKLDDITAKGIRSLAAR